MYILICLMWWGVGGAEDNQGLKVTLHTLSASCVYFWAQPPVLYLNDFG